MIHIFINKLNKVISSLIIKHPLLVLFKNKYDKDNEYLAYLKKRIDQHNKTMNY
jgi:hypothetical protein